MDDFDDLEYRADNFLALFERGEAYKDIRVQ